MAEGYCGYRAVNPRIEGRLEKAEAITFGAGNF